MFREKQALQCNNDVTPAALQRNGEKEIELEIEKDLPAKTRVEKPKKPKEPKELKDEFAEYVVAMTNTDYEKLLRQQLKGPT